MSNYDHLPTEAINEQITQLESIVGSSEPPKPEKPSLFSPAGADKLNSEMGAVFDRLQNANEKRSHEEAVLKPGLKGATDGFRKREYEGAANTLPSHASGNCNPAH